MWKKRILSITLLFSVVSTCTITLACKKPSNPFDGTRWRVVTFRGRAPLKGTSMSLGFSKWRAGGNATCNGWGGNVMLWNGTIKFSRLSWTSKACVNGLKGQYKQERTYVQTLGKVTRYERKKDRLLLFIKKKQVLSYKLIPKVRAAALEGSAWRLESWFHNMGGTMMASHTRTTRKHSLQLNKGKATAKTLCGRLEADYTLKGERLRFQKISAKGTKCPSKDDAKEHAQFVKAIKATTHYRIKARALTLIGAQGELLDFRAVK